MRRLVVCGIAASLSLGVFAESWQNDEGVIRTWNSGQLLPATYEVEQDASRKTVVLENVQLADVEVVSSRLNANGWPTSKVDVQWWGVALPYNEKRTDGELVVDLQSVNVNSEASPYGCGRTVSIRLTLVQDGADVCACVSHALYVDGQNAIGLDLLSKSVKAVYSVGVIDLATPLSTATGYGIDQLTFSVKTPRGRKEYVQTEALAVDETLEVGTNVAVTIDAAQVFAEATSLSNPISLAPGAELAFENLATGTEVRSVVSGGAATLTLRRTAADAAGDLPSGSVIATDTNVINITRIPNTLLLSVTNVTVAYGKKAVNSQGWMDGVQVWHFENNGRTATFQAQYNQPEKGTNYIRCVMVTMKQEGGDIVLSGFDSRGKGNVDFGYRFGQSGESTFYPYTPERDATGVNYLAIRGVTLYCDERMVNTGVDTINAKTIYDTKLSSVTNVVGLWGKKIAPNGGWEADTRTYFFANNGQTATFQVQWLQGANSLRGELITLKQVGPDITVSFASKIAAEDFGFDLANGTITDTAPSEDKFGLAVKGLVLICDVPQTQVVKPVPEVNLAAGAIGVTNGTVKVDGLFRLSLVNMISAEYKTRFMPLLPIGGWFELSNGARFHLENWGAYGQGTYHENRCGFRVGAGCLMTLAGNWPLDDFFPFVVDNGELRLGGRNPTPGTLNQYISNLTLKNGARLTGRDMRIGYIHDGNWWVSGTEPSVCEAGVNLHGREENGVSKERYLKLNVDDVTGNAEVDFTLSGTIYRGIDDGNLASPRGGVWKLGKGTAKLAAQNTYTGPTKVTGGTLLLGVSQCIPQTNEVNVAGGALAFAAGTTTTFDRVAFGAGTNTLEIAKGATVTFGEMTFGDDVLAINIAGEDASTCVFPRMPASIRRSKLLLNGERAMQDAEGHVVPYEPQGAVIIFR